MFDAAWVDRALIMAVSGLAAFLLALLVVRVWRAFSGSQTIRRPPTARRRRMR